MATTLSLEALAVLAYLAVTIAEFARSDSSTAANGLAYLVIAAIGALWAVGCALAAWRGQGWARGAIITWQLVQLAVGVGCVEGLVGGWLVGVFLLAFGLLGFVLALTPPVTRALARR